MIVVIQCASSKRKDAGTMLDAEGRPVRFVAQPTLAPQDGEVYARPDDVAEGGSSWRDLLSRYGAEPDTAPVDLLPAGALYRPSVYEALRAHIAPERLFILSAGWGLVRADFPLPAYDITFSAQADIYKRRRLADEYQDFRMLDPDVDEPVLLFAGKDYVPLFCRLTASLRAPRIVLHKSAKPPECPGCIPVHYETDRNTNWHYGAAEAFVAGRLSTPL